MLPASTPLRGTSTGGRRRGDVQVLGDAHGGVAEEAAEEAGDVLDAGAGPGQGSGGEVMSGRRAAGGLRRRLRAGVRLPAGDEVLRSNRPRRRGGRHGGTVDGFVDHLRVVYGQLTLHLLLRGSHCNTTSFPAVVRQPRWNSGENLLIVGGKEGKSRLRRDGVRRRTRLPNEKGRCRRS